MSQHAPVFQMKGDDVKVIFTPVEFTATLLVSIGGSGGGCRAHATLRDQILSFSHTFLPKSTHVGGPRPPNGSTPSPTGNPGSAIGKYQKMCDLREILNTLIHS